MRLTENECKKVKAGGITGNLVSALTKLFTTIKDVGRSLGSSIRRLVSKNACPL